MGLISFISWFVLGFFGGLIFAKKGYPPNIGILVGILLGPLALAICLFLPKTASGCEQARLKEEFAAEELAASRTKDCPNCRRTVGVMSRFCPRCNYRFKIAAPKPCLLHAESLLLTERGSMVWNSDHNADLLTVSNSGMTIEWGPRKPEYTGKHYPPAWVPATTMCQLHSGRFSWDFVVIEMSERQIGVGFMLLWDVGPDWGFFGYLGASSTAWSYDPSTGDVVTSTESIQGNLPTFADGHTGTVSVELKLPRDAEGSGLFSINGTTSRPIELPNGAVVLPAACLLKESQKITIENFRTLENTA